MIETKVLNIAIILAAGQQDHGETGVPPQLVKLAGKPLVEHSILAFQRNGHVDAIVVVANHLCVREIESIVSNNGYSKVKRILLGGEHRFQSSMIAIEATREFIGGYAVRLIFHDGIRPLVSQSLIDTIITSLDVYGAVGTAIESPDSIIEVDTISGLMRSVPRRGSLQLAQTPQAFRHEVIESAYRLAMRDPNFEDIDDCSAVRKYLPTEPIYLVRGWPSNMKFHRDVDLQLLDRLFQLKSTEAPEIDNRWSSLGALVGKVVVVFGGTSGIGKSIVEIATAYDARVIAAGTRSGTDIRDITEVRDVFDSAVNKYGCVDCVINCAGVLLRQPLINMSTEDISRVIDVNYVGAVSIALEAFLHLKKSSGMLINFTSSSYTYGRAMYSVYSSTKAAVVNLTQALADEWRSHGIRVNCMNPERTATPMRRGAFGVESEESLLDPRMVAERTLLVACGESTGSIFDVRRLR